MANGLHGIFRHQRFEFSLGLFVLAMGNLGSGKNASEFRPGVGAAQVHNANRLNSRLRRLNPEEGGGLAAFDAAPEFPLGGDDQVLVERVRIGLDLDPLAAAGNDGEYGLPGREDPHVVLQLGHVFGCGRLFGERPRQHELRLEHFARVLDPAIERRRHPVQHRVKDAALHIRQNLA